VAKRHRISEQTIYTWRTRPVLQTSSLILCKSALGQVVQYQYTPPPPVVALPFHPFESPSTLQIPGVVPPDRVVTRSARQHRAARASPETHVIPDFVGIESGFVQVGITRHGRVVVVPPAVVPGQELYSDRLARCAQGGAAAGIGANHLGAFTARCAN
jgi:hypothetical protein